eukprot:gene10333-8269_t
MHLLFAPRESISSQSFLLTALPSCRPFKVAIAVIFSLDRLRHLCIVMADSPLISIRQCVHMRPSHGLQRPNMFRTLAAACPAAGSPAT